MEFKKKLFSTLYWKISALFMIILFLVGGIYIAMTSVSINQFFLETKQMLNKNVANQVIDDVDLFEEGELNKSGAKMVMMHHMKVNPSAEVYVLDKEGQILAYDAPDNKIIRDRVDISAVKDFVSTQGENFIEGDDPRKEECTKIFSAAPIVEQGSLQGYVYVILASEEYESTAEPLMNSLIYTIGKNTLLITLVVGILVGLLAIWFLTKNLRVIEKGVARFEKEDFSQPIQIDSDGEFGQLASTINKMASTIDRNIKELKSMESLRKELVANVSHDLRTPLAVIHGYAETLAMKKGGLSNEDEQKFLQNILKSTKNLEELVSELFELSKLESSKIVLKKEKVNLAELLNDIVSRYQILADKKDITLTLDVKATPLVSIDIALMERAVQNLVQNALKFTPDGGSIGLKIEEDNGFIKVEVKDSGLGIAEEYLPFVFDRYKKVEGENRDKTGAGLGLAIVKKIMELHDFKIDVKSKVNRGTSFEFAFPKM